MQAPSQLIFMISLSGCHLIQEPRALLQYEQSGLAEHPQTLRTLPRFQCSARQVWTWVLLQAATWEKVLNTAPQDEAPDTRVGNGRVALCNDTWAQARHADFLLSSALAVHSGLSMSSTTLNTSYSGCWYKLQDNLYIIWQVQRKPQYFFLYWAINTEFIEILVCTVITWVKLWVEWWCA